MRNLCAFLRFGLLLFLVPAPAGAADFNELVSEEVIRPKGQWYEATVPDTLDLAARAKLAINGLVGNIDPEKFYSVLFMFDWGCNPPKIRVGNTWNLPSKNLRALPWMRTMCGSEQGLDIESNTMRVILEQLSEDGFLYAPIGTEGPPSSTAYPNVTGLAALAMWNWFERDGNRTWLDKIALMSKGLREMAIQVEDRAYYPPESAFGKDGKWHFTNRGKPYMAYQPPEEPDNEVQGFEQCVKWHQSAPLRVLLRDYQQNGHQQSLDLAHKIYRFYMKPGMWEDLSHEGLPVNETGIWSGHFHGNVAAMHALLEYAIATNDEKAKQIARQAYDHARRVGIHRIGFFPFWYLPSKAGRADERRGFSEGCCTSDMVLMAVKLTDAGLGDYWDDVDCITRNHLIEQQIIDLDLMREVSGVKPGDPGDDLLKRFLGGVSGAGLTMLSPGPLMFGCCTPNTDMALYYAWHGITRFDSGIATVNLFLNRAAPWLDVDSYLPYEGKVVLRNKQAHTAMVRMPSWLERKSVLCFVNDELVRPALAGRYLVFGKLARNAVIRLEFPVVESTEKYYIYDKTYTIRFRGNTVVDIRPRDKEQMDWKEGIDTGPPEWKTHIHPVYQRDRFKKTKTPMHNVRRFVADKILPLQ